MLDEKSRKAQRALIEEYRIKVFKRGLELRNWSAAAKEFSITCDTLKGWRFRHHKILEKIAFELGVDVYKNPKTDSEEYSKRPDTLQFQQKSVKTNTTRMLTHCEAAALILKKAKVLMTTQRIFKEISLCQLKPNLNFDELTASLIENSKKDDSFKMMKTTGNLCKELIYAFRLKLNPASMSLLQTAYSALDNNVKPFFSSTTSCFHRKEMSSSKNSSSLNGKQINFLVPNLCVTPISITDDSNHHNNTHADTQSSIDDVTMASSCLKVYLRESSIPVFSDSLFHETRPSPVRSLIASDRRRSNVKSTFSPSEYTNNTGVNTPNGLTPCNESMLADGINASPLTVSIACNSATLPRQISPFPFNTDVFPKLLPDIISTPLSEMDFQILTPSLNYMERSQELPSLMADATISSDAQKPGTHISTISLPESVISPTPLFEHKKRNSFFQRNESLHYLTDIGERSEIHNCIEMTDVLPETPEIQDTLSIFDSTEITSKLEQATTHDTFSDYKYKKDGHKRTGSKQKKKKNGSNNCFMKFLMENDIKNLITKINLDLYFSPDEKAEMILLMPEVDQILSPSDPPELSETSFTNEYFTQALIECTEDIICGEVNFSFKSKKDKNETRKKSIDLWKIKHLQAFDSYIQTSQQTQLLSKTQDIDHTKRYLSNFISDPVLRNLFLHPTTLAACMDALTNVPTYDDSVSIDCTDAYQPLYPLNTVHPPPTINLILPEDCKQSEETPSSSSNMVISLPRLTYQLDRGVVLDIPTDINYSSIDNSSGMISSKDTPPTKKLKYDTII